MTNIRSNELALAINMAFDATPETLEALANLSTNARNSEQVYEQLGMATGASVTPVIAYILEQTRREDDVAIYAVQTLSSINTPEAEKTILEIARAVLGNQDHPLQRHIGADSISALQAMGTDTAADKILELGRDYDVLVHQALINLEAMYNGNPQGFKSQYRQMLEFVNSPEVMDRVVSIACDAEDVPLLAAAFKRADEHRIFPEASDQLRSTAEQSGQGSVPKGFCSFAFNLALAERASREALQQIQNIRAEHSTARHLG